MILGISQFCSEDPVQFISKAVSLNVHVVQLLLDYLMERKSDLQEASRKAIAHNVTVFAHAPTCDIYLASPNKGIRLESVSQIVNAANFASDIGAKALIVHAEFIPRPFSPYTLPNLLDSLARILLAVEDQDIVIALENTYEKIQDITHCVTYFANEKLRLALDIGHAYLTRDCPNLIFAKQIARIMICMHVHDNDGINDMHLVLGKGVVPIEKYINLCMTSEHQCYVIIENNNFPDLIESLTWLRRFWNRCEAK